MINQDDDADLKHNKITSFLIKEFGNSILFGDAEIKNQSFSFSSPTKVQNIINSLQNIDVVKTAAIDIRKSLLEVNFWLENSFYDAHQLKQSWKEITFLDALLYFFTALFNVSSTKLMRSKTASGINDCIFEECLVEKENEEETQHSPLMTRTKSLFLGWCTIMSLKEKQPSPPLVMNTHAIYQHCKSCELIVSFSRQSTCISYKTIKKLRKDLEKYSLAKFLVSCTSTQSFWQKLFQVCSNE